MTKIIPGGIATDDRGSLSFVNDFELQKYKRFYNIQNHGLNFVRAWHGHKLEEKVFFPQKGTFLVCAVKIDDWDKPSKDLQIEKWILSENQPRALVIPPGYANGSMNLTEGAILTVFSSSSLDESKGDDYRFASRFWDSWEIEER